MYIRRRTTDLDATKVDADADYEQEFHEWKDEAPNYLRSASNLERLEELAGTSGSYSDRAVQLMVAQDPNWIDREALKRVVVKQQQRVVGCLSLPFSLGFFLVFAFSVFMHEDITMVYVIESGLRHKFGENTDVDGVENLPGVWDWLNGELVPKLFDQTDLLGRPVADKSEWSWVLMYNQLKGPMVLEQSRSKVEPCSEGAGIVEDMICYPRETVSDETYGRTLGADGFSPQTHVAAPDQSAYADQTQIVTLADRLSYYDSAFSPSQVDSRRLRAVDNSYSVPNVDSSRYKAFIYPNTPRPLIQEHLNYLYQKGWLDAQSKQLEIKALLLNSEVGRPRLEQLIVTFMFNRGGGVFTKLALQSLFLVMYPNMMTMMSDFTWVCMLIFITVKECSSVSRAFRDGKLREKFSKFMTLLEWFIIFCGIFIIFSYLVMHILRQGVMQRYNEVVAAEAGDVPADFNTLGVEMHSETDSMIKWSSIFRIVVAEYQLVIMFRFFAAFKAQPRLGIVVSTLESSVVDIIHFLIVLMPTFLAYAISGNFIFGRRVEEFSTLEKSIGVCFKMIMEGEYDWPALSLEHYYTALFWTWTFMLLLVLLMLNMVLAIIMDIYTEMRRSAGNSETVWMTLYYVFLHAYYRKQWISNKEILGHVDAMKRLVTREELQKEFPRMCEAQLDSLVSACDQDSEHAGGAGMTDSMKLILAVKFCIDCADQEIAELGNDLEEQKLIDTSGQPETYKPSKVGERGWLQEISEKMAVQNHRMIQIQWQLQQVQWQWHTVEALRQSTESQAVLDSLPDIRALLKEGDEIIL